MRTIPLASRVTGALVGTVALFLFVMSLLAYEVFSRMEDDLVDSVLAGQVQALRDDLAAGQDLSAVLSARASDGGSIQAWVQPASEPSPADGMFVDGAGQREVHRAGRTWHTWVEAVPQGTLYVRYDATAHERRVREFGVILAVGALLTLAFAWVLARHLARRVVAPIRLVSSRLTAWSLGEARTPLAAGDEAIELVTAFSRIQDHVDRAMAFERQFAANLSHELRTPLAALRSDGEMALLEVRAGSVPERRLRRMLAQVDLAASSLAEAVAMNNTDPARVQAVSLHRALEDAWFGLQPLAQARGLVLLDRVPEGLSCRLDRHALMIVLRNLLRNAIDHAAPATLMVSFEAPATLKFSDDGPGIPPERLQALQARRRGRRDLSAENPEEGRHGLGLGIAWRICDLQGWELTVASARLASSAWTEFSLALLSGSLGIANDSGSGQLDS